MSEKSSRKCYGPKKKVFQGKVFIPDDHIQLISKYFQGANLNMNFVVSEEENSDRDSSQKKRKFRSRSRSDKNSNKKKRKTIRSRSNRRTRRRREHKSKRCKCCKCHEEKVEISKSCCCGPVKCTQKAKEQGCCHQIDPCTPASRNCCSCCPPTDPCKTARTKEPACCCNECKKDCDPVKPTICCCKKPPEPEPEKICCCCGRPCVEKNVNRSKHENTEKSKPKLVENEIHRHTSCCCRCNKNSVKEEKDGNKKEVSKNDKKIQPKEELTKPSQTSTGSNGTKSKSSSVAGDGNVKQVYVTKNVSNLETDEVYGRYWYHRPPLQNTIIRCDDDEDDDYPEPVPPRPPPRYPRQRDDGRPRDYRRPPVEIVERSRNSTGLCLACKEPMCFLCNLSICECDCDKPNFVICNPCKHRLTPKPPKKPCPPKKPKTKPKIQSVQTYEACDEAMYLLPLLATMQASMQGNNHFQQCDC